MLTIKNQIKIKIIAIVSLFFFYMNAHVEQKVFVPTLENLNVLTIMPANAKCTHNNTIVLKDLIAKVQNNYNDILHELLYVKYGNRLTEHLVIKGIPEINDEKKFITIHSRGFASYKKILNSFRRTKVPTKGGGVLCAYPMIRDRYIHTPCIMFDYPDQQFANFAQSLDLNCLDTIVKSIPSDYKKVYFGTSCGATNLLKYWLLNRSDNDPSAIILESPFLSIKNVIGEHIAAAPVLSYMPGAQYLIQQCALALMKLQFPNYKQHEDNLESYLSNIESSVPILFVHLKNDLFVSDEEMFTMVTKLAEQNPNIYLLVVHDPSNTVGHGKLSKTKEFQTLNNAFLKKCEIPHDKKLAQKGQNLLKIARKNACANSPDGWKIIDLKKDNKTS